MNATDLPEVSEDCRYCGAQVLYMAGERSANCYVCGHIVTRPIIDGEIRELPDGTKLYVLSDIPLEWFADARGPEAMRLAEERARAKHGGRKAEH